MELPDLDSLITKAFVDAGTPTFKLPDLEEFTFEKMFAQLKDLQKVRTPPSAIKGRPATLKKWFEQLTEEGLVHVTNTLQASWYGIPIVESDLLPEGMIALSDGKDVQIWVVDVE